MPQTIKLRNGDFMKKRNTKYLHLPCHIFFILLLIFSLFFSSTPIQAAACPKVHAHAYVIMDANTGKVLLSKQSKKKIYPASTVKLMTALVVLDKYKTTKKIKITKQLTTFIFVFSITNLLITKSIKYISIEISSEMPATFITAKGKFAKKLLIAKII